MKSPSAIAAEAFAETLEELGRQNSAADLSDPAVVGRRAALLVSADRIWGQVLGPLYEVEQAKAILGVRSRQAVSDLARRGRLLALDGPSGRKLYPAFQFAASGRPYPEIARLLEIFTGVVQTPYTIASWVVSAQDLLEGETPAAWMRAGRDPELLLEAARRSAERLAH